MQSFPSSLISNYRRCKLGKGSLTMASIDIMYIDVTRRWNADLPEGTAGGMVFGAFLEAFFLIARKKARGDTLLEKVSRLVDYCECNLNEGVLAIPKKGSRKLRRPEMGHYKFRRLGPLDSWRKIFLWMQLIVNRKNKSSAKVLLPYSNKDQWL